MIYVLIWFCQTKVINVKKKLLMSHKLLTTKLLECSLLDPKMFVVDKCNLN